MGEVAHTPGPWALIQFGGNQIGNPETGEAICTMWGSDFTDPETGIADPWRANARLIAAAPELLEALERLKPILDRAESNASGNMEWEGVSVRINAARAAIAKARGLTERTKGSEQ